jgi:hypothetical protein
MSGFGGVGASSSHRRIGRLSGGGLAVLFLQSKRASSLMTMLPEVCELAPQAGLEIIRFYRAAVAWKEDASLSRTGTNRPRLRLPDRI